MAHTDRFGNVWVKSEDASKLFLKAKEALREFDSLHGADLFEGEGFETLIKAMHKVRRIVERIDSL